MAKVVISAGHEGVGNGLDCGAVGGGIYEANINLEVANKVGAILDDYVQVVYTRTGAYKNELADKVRIANGSGADYFVEIHCNAAENVSAKGTETFSYSETGKGRELASKIQPKLVQAIGSTNRGLKTANFYVLRNTNMPAVLIELAFITNVEDRNMLINKQNEMALAIAKGILEQLGITYKEPVVEAPKPTQVEGQGWRIVCGYYENYDNAKHRVAELEALGLNPYLIPYKKGE